MSKYSGKYFEKPQPDANKKTSDLDFVISSNIFFIPFLK